MSDRVHATTSPLLRTAVAVMTMLAIALATVTAAAPEARAAGPYTLSGAVTFAPGYGSSDLSSVFNVVKVESTTSPANYLGRYDDKTGRWTVPNVPEGTYTVKIDPSWISPLGMEYFPGVPVRDQATVVTVTGDRNNIDFTLEPKIENPTTWPRIFRGASEAFFLAVGDTLRIEAPVFPFETTLVGYRWYRDGELIPGAVGQEYTLTVAELGKEIAVGYIAARTGYTPREFREENIFEVSKGSFAPKNVTITGEARVGNTLMASTSGWTPTPSSFTWRWQRNGVDIPGATSAAYTLTPADNGTTVRVVATAKLEGYFDAERWASSQVREGRFSTVPTVSLPATVRVGTPVAANVEGSWTPTPDSISYQWLSDGVPVAGATSLTYTPRAGDLNKALVVRVTAKKGAYEDRSVSSANKWPTVGVLANSVLPSITGTLKPGETLTAKPGTWSPTASYTYRWLRDGSYIDGATSSKYKLPSNARGSKFSVQVTATKTGYGTAYRTSNPVEVLPLFTKASTPTISGTGNKGFTLKAKPGTWTPAPDALSYQWYRDGKAISGAKASTYKLVAADSGKKISVKVTAKKAGYETTSKTSAKKSLGKFFSKSPVPKISGTAKVGKTLTAKVGTWSPKPSKFTYQWYRNGKAISKATKSTYKVKAADAGKKITVKVTAKRSGYATTAKTSAAKTVALQSFKTVPTPKITGTKAVGATLNVTVGTWSPKPSSYTYQWYRGGVAIVGATAKTYVLTEADAGAKITVKVTGKKSGYKAKAVTSKAVTIKPIL